MVDPMPKRDAIGARAAYEKAKADQRYKDRPVGGRGNKVGGNASTDFELTKSRDAIGARVGVSGRTSDMRQCIPPTGTI